jgi:hypothetical protein
MHPKPRTTREPTTTPKSHQPKQQLQALLLPFVSMTLFIEDRKFFVRESASKLYSTSNYFLANALLELVLTTTCAIIYGAWLWCFV